MISLRIFWAFAVFSYFILGRLPFISANLSEGGPRALYTVLELLLIVYIILWTLFGQWWIRHTIGYFWRRKSGGHQRQGFV